MRVGCVCGWVGWRGGGGENSCMSRSMPRPGRPPKRAAPSSGAAPAASDGEPQKVQGGARTKSEAKAADDEADLMADDDGADLRGRVPTKLQAAEMVRRSRSLSTPATLITRLECPQEPTEACRAPALLLLC